MYPAKKLFMAIVAASILVLNVQYAGAQVATRVEKIFMKLFDDDAGKGVRVMLKDATGASQEVAIINDPKVYASIDKKMREGTAIGYEDCFKMIDQAVLDRHMSQVTADVYKQKVYYQELRDKIPRQDNMPLADYEAFIEGEMMRMKLTSDQALDLEFTKKMEPYNKALLHPATDAEVEARMKQQMLSRIKASQNEWMKTPVSLANIDKLQVVVSMPSTDQEYKQLFGEYQQQADAIISLRKNLVAENNPHVKFPQSSSAMDQYFRSTTDKHKPVVIIGHNIDGKIKFPDGSEKDIKELDSMAKATSRMVIYLSCKTAGYTTNAAPSYYLTYEEAIKLTHRFNGEEPGAPFPAASESQKFIYQRIIDQYGREKQLKFRMKVTAITTASGYGLYYVATEKRNSRPAVAKATAVR